MFKDELRGLKVGKGQAEDKCRELETVSSCQEYLTYVK